LYELSCMMSDPGSQRQVVHPDTPCASANEDPVLYTCFVALQDVQLDMGPTTWLPGTHTVDNHRLFRDESTPDGQDENNKDKLLRTKPSVIGLLPKGSCGIFDSRLLHCGGANTSPTSRAIFYISFKSPKITNPGNPGSIRRDYISKFTLSELEKELTLYAKGKDSPRIYHS
jgi:ectoine hydroxylase-related dioxygenase (phytanoyl-CoA dioxygenase family)